ncbi:hypothetical protein OV208_36790 [Corallococcus sp. bb12-1]|uniref:hypothetical protein n=1 Tax=Corallococcus sp. bb12-1 TaxID=2996784 RepID=UPI00226DB1BE|nr:hypothetical protein [Corallococcus sp. bb12-1]MCY1046920.1 hypothetical protein [Corallococcus sp. bb12-1]
MPTGFEPWLSALPADEAARIREEALRRMGPEPDAFESFRWYLELRTHHDEDSLRDVRALRGKRLGSGAKHADQVVSLIYM